MNIDFNFGWFGGLLGFLINVALLVGLIVAVLLLVRRLVVAWHNWGQLPELDPFASRAQLLNEGMPLVGLHEGSRLGKAKDVILDLDTGSVAGFRVRSHWQTRFLPFEKVKSIGRDAITVESEADLLEPQSALPLARLAANKYRWDQCEVVTEGGSCLGTTSWRRLWYDRTDGKVELAIETSYQSFVNALLGILIELGSIFQPVANWLPRPDRFSIRVPLSTVQSATRKMVILNAEGEAQFHETMQVQASRTREGLNESCNRLRNLVRRPDANWPMQSSAQKTADKVETTK